MMRLIDADSLYRRVKTECNPYGKPTIEYESGCKVLDWIDSAPTIDAEPIVRCKDCRYCTDCKYGDAYCMMNMIWYKEDHYCSDGIRKKRRNE